MTLELFLSKGGAEPIHISNVGQDADCLILSESLHI